MRSSLLVCELSFPSIAWTYLIFSITGGRFLAESTPWTENTASSATWSCSSVCTNLRVVGPSKRSILYFVRHWVSYVSVTAKFITIALRLCLLLPGWPGVDPLFPRFQMRSFPRPRLSVALDVVKLICFKAHRHLHCCSGCPFRFDQKYAVMGQRVCGYGTEGFTYLLLWL